MKLQVNGFSSKGKRVTSFCGEVSREFVSVVVRGVLASPGVDWVSVNMWKGTQPHRCYQVEKDFSWLRIW